MGRPVYPYELGDPDFSWLVTNFADQNPQYCQVEISNNPLTFILDATVSIEELSEAVEEEENLQPSPARDEKPASHLPK